MNKSMHGPKKASIGVVTPPISQANVIPVWNLIDIVSCLANNVHFVAVNSTQSSYQNNKMIRKRNSDVIIYELMYKSGKNVFTRVLIYFQAQLWASLQILRVFEKVDLWVFYLGDELFFPMLVTKILRRKAILIIGGFMEKETWLRNDFLGRILILFKKINCALSEVIVVYSKNLIKEWTLEKYVNKISIAHRHFLDFNKFKIQKQLSDRERVIGYIGRLSEEKGILDFVRAIPKVLEKEGDVRFIIGGDGNLFREVQNFINENGLNKNVKLLGWVPHDDLPTYLNELKLLVLPSFTEGLPNIMLEAIACGTPVLATSVGAIPDVIKDHETGFIMKSNSSKCIAENIIKVLKYPKLSDIIENARESVNKEFRYEATVEKWKKIFNNFTSC
jgi:glycosyltransferase involved in cell wall biosynthesis